MPRMPAICRFDLRDINPPIFSGHLQLGGYNLFGDKIEFTNYYMTLNGHPFIGISGEFHYSRYPHAYWEEELAKMKATGINIITTYIFWIHHEEVQGSFDWSGDRDLRYFAELCARQELYLLVRIGPFAHGECRNGGLPDWLYGQPYEVRSNHPDYLAQIDRLYRQIAGQLHGLLFKDGGPVIGVQLENEYGAAAAPWEAADRNQPLEWLPSGQDGVSHMENLKRLAMQAGLEVPIYTMTAWGSPLLEKECLPVFGGYAYPVWIDKPAPSDLYIFQDLHATLSPNREYPLANAEMQGGIQIRYYNRPFVPPESTSALAIVRLGSGSNIIGYYIYHGGSNPRGNNGFTNERLHPQVSYDFQAPIGEYGQITHSARKLKTLHQFIETFGKELAPMQTILPASGGAIDPEDTHTPRICVRSKDGSGFIFLNNFQDHVEMQDQENLRIELEFGNQTLRLPENYGFTLKKDQSCIFFFFLSLADSRLVYATAQPLTYLHYGQETHYFFIAPEGITPEYCLDNAGVNNLSGNFTQVHTADHLVTLTIQPGIDHHFTYTTPLGMRIRVTTLTQWEAEHAWRGTTWGQERLVVSNADVVFIQDGIELISQNETQLEIHIVPCVPILLRAIHGKLEKITDGCCSHYHASVIPKHIDFTSQDIGKGKIFLQFPSHMMDGVHDIFLHIDYEGDTSAAFVDGNLIADHYNHGTPWSIGLKRFFPALIQKGLCLVFRPLREGDYKNISTTMAGNIFFEGGEHLHIRSITIKPEYRVKIIHKPG